MNGKGDAPRKVDRKKWDDCPLWENLKKEKPEEAELVEEAVDKYKNVLKELKD